jgi:hypothetical protein
MHPVLGFFSLYITSKEKKNQTHDECTKKKNPTKDACTEKKNLTQDA